MPYMNVLDIAMFPATSRYHIHLIRSLRGMLVINEEEIWKIEAKVWEELPIRKFEKNVCIERMIAYNIVKFKEGNILLERSKGGFASGLRKEFNNTG